MKIYLFLLIAFCSLNSFGQQLDYSVRNKPYYTQQGRVAMHLSNFMFAANGTIIPPVNFHVEATVVKNLTVGLMFTYFQFKFRNGETANATRWTGSNVKYNEFMGAIRASYHLNHLIQKMMKRRFPDHIVDVYISSWIGHSFIKANHSFANQELMDKNQKVRGGVAIGARSMVLSWLGFMFEGGYSSYGYGSFGLSFILN